MVPGEDVPASDLTPFSSYILIDHWLSKLHFAAGNAQHQVTVPVDAHFACTVHFQRNGFGVGTRRDHEVILKTALIAVEHKIDAGINSGIFHAAIARNVCVPSLWIVPYEVIHFGGQGISSGDLRFRIRSLETHANRGHLCSPPRFAECSNRGSTMERRQVERPLGTQRENSFLRCQKEFVPAAARNVSHFASRLALVFFKAQGQVAVGCAPVRITFRRGDFGRLARRDL